VWLRTGGKQHINEDLFHGDETAIGPDALMRTDHWQSTREGATASGMTSGLTCGENGLVTYLNTETLNSQPSILYNWALIIGTENICGAQGQKELDGETHDLGKIKQHALHMVAPDQDTPLVELLQESWLLNDWIHHLHGILIIHHGTPKKNWWGFGGIAILLNRKAKQAWNLAGRPEPYQPGSVDSADPTCRVIGIMLRFLATRHKHKSETFFVCTTYAPDSGAIKKAQAKQARSADPLKTPPPPSTFISLLWTKLQLVTKAPQFFWQRHKIHTWQWLQCVNW